MKRIIIAAAAAALSLVTAVGASLDVSKFGHRAFITFAGYEGESTLTNFPALVKIAENVGGFSYSDCAQANGGDVRFSLGNVELPSEVVTWDQNGTSVFYVRVPELTSQTTIVMNWGNANAPSRPANERVWDTNYRAVWGMEDSGRAIVDASIFGTHGAAPDDSTEEQGMVGKARYLTKDKWAQCGFGMTDYLLTTNYTWEAWYKISAYPNGNSAIAAFGAGNANICALCIGNEGRPGPNSGQPGSGKVALNEWHHALVSESGGTATFYLDGVKTGTAGVRQPKVEDASFFPQTVRVRLGFSESSYFGSRNYKFQGSVDEVRFSGVARSADYAKAVVQNVTNVNSFLTVSASPQVAFSVTMTDDLDMWDDARVRYLSAGAAKIFSGGVEVEEVPAGAKHVVTVTPVAKQVQITVAAGEGGSVSNAQDAAWVDAGSVVRVCAKPTDAVHTAFYKWDGDCPLMQTYTAEIAVPADRPRALTAKFATAHYVRPEKGAGGETAFSDANDGLTPETAKCTVEGTLPGLPSDEPSVIWVYDGEYKITNTVGRTTCSIRIDKPVAVRSVNGPDKVSFDLQNSNNREGFGVYNSGAVLDGLTVKNGNESSHNYAANYQSAGMIQNCVFTNCANSYSGGTSQTLDMTGGTVWKTLFVGMKGKTGAAIRENGSGAIVDSCVFRDGEGGNVNLKNGVVRNCLFTGLNRTRNGGGVEIDGSGTLVDGCTFVDNQTTASGGGVGAGTAATGQLVVNSAFLNNASSGAATGPDCWNVPTVNSCGYYLEQKMGCIAAAPTFAETEEDPYVFRPNGVSRLCDAALYSPWAWEPGAVDLSGLARVAGKGMDIGAFEYVPSGDEKLEVNVNAETLDADHGQVRFSAIVSGVKGSATYLWEFGDGETSSLESPTHTYAAAGYYTVRLTVTDSAGGEPAVFEQADFVKLIPSTVYVHAADETHVPTEPYATPETAADTLRKAYGVGPKRIVVLEGPAASGDDVEFSTVCEIVGEGPEKSALYVNAGNWGLTLSKPGVLLHDVMLQGKGSSIATYGARMLTVGEGTVVSNVIVTGYVANNSSSVCVNGGTMVDCVVRNCTKGCVNQGGQALEIASGLIDRCTITNNTLGARSGGGDGIGIKASGNSIVRNSLIARNWAQTVYEQGAVAASGDVTIENCTIVSNVFTKVDGAGGLYVTGNGVTAVNTLVWGNVAKTNEVLLLEAQSDVKVAAGVTATFDHSLAFGLPDLASGQVTVTDCLSADPKFNCGLKASVPYWGVLGTSPCKNKGVKLDWMTGATDLVGNPRVFGGKPDIGCYECQVGGLVIIVR